MAPTMKAKLADPDARLTAHIATIPSPVVTQAIAAGGADAVVVDLEHGAVDWSSAHAMIAATAGTGCAPLVRVVENAPREVKRALDLGAEGIVFPMIRTADDARAAVAAMRYPPDGVRGFGPFVAHSRWQTTLAGYRPEIADSLVCILLIETRDAIGNIEEICEVDGVDMLIPAQFDLSTDLGCPGDFAHPEFVAAIEKVREAAGRHGMPLGQAAPTPEAARALFASGYRLAAGFDALWVRAMTEAYQATTKP